MNKTIIVGSAAVLVLIGLALMVGYRGLDQDADPVATTTAAMVAADTAVLKDAPGFLYGRVATYDAGTYEGRLRWGGDEEAFWGHYFNGFKDENPWAAVVPLDRMTEDRPPINLFGLKFQRGERPLDLGRPFMVRFGDIARIEARGDGVRINLESGVEYDPNVRVILKSGAVFDLNRLEAGDFDDGLRVWDPRRGAVDLEAHRIRTIEFLPTPPLSGIPERLHGTVHTRGGRFSGYVQWDREEATGRDLLVGHSAEGQRALRFDTIHAIARQAAGGAVVTLQDGSDLVLSGTRKVDSGNRGLYVDDPRYGRVLVSWDAFERIDFSPAGSGPAYTDFPAGHRLTGTVTTRHGRRLTGRLVYDLDESETTETLDAPGNGVDYTLPFGLVAAIVLPGPAARTTEHAEVRLHSGEKLQLERSGDLGPGHAGVLVFAEGGARPEYVPWADIQRIDFDRPPVLHPPVGAP